MKTLSLLTFFFALVSTNTSATPFSFEEFISAYNTANQPNATMDDVVKLTDLFAEDVVDFHAAYKVTVEGNKTMAINVHNYAKRIKQYNATAKLIHWNDYFAALVLEEKSAYLKQGKLKNYHGKTLLILEFAESGKIKHIRRYHH